MYTYTYAAPPAFVLLVFVPALVAVDAIGVAVAVAAYLFRLVKYQG